MTVMRIENSRNHGGRPKTARIGAGALGATLAVALIGATAFIGGCGQNGQPGQAGQTAPNSTNSATSTNGEQAQNDSNSAASENDEQARNTVAPTTRPPTTPANSSSTAPRSTPLFSAVAAGNVEQVRTLLENGADPNERVLEANYGAFAPLHSIARNNSVATEDRLEIIRLLIDAGADVNIRADADHQAMPLHWAARVGALEVVQMLVENGAEVNGLAGTGQPQTPMRFAAVGDYTEVVFYLREHGGHL